MMNPKTAWEGIDRSDRMFVVGSIIAPIIIWWYYKGRHKYNLKGMK